MSDKVRLDAVTIKWLVDVSPDTSYMGEYTDDYNAAFIVALGEHEGEFAGDVPDDELPDRRREYRYFSPYAGGEKPGSKHYRKYAQQDFKRAQGMNRGDWCYMGCRADATVSYDIWQGNRRLERFTSGGLWGIESDSDADYKKEIEDGQIADLKSHLETFGVAWRDDLEIERGNN